MVKILLVEDDPIISTIYRLKLEANNYEVVVAHNGVEGLAETRKTSYDLILLDLRMPLMDGEEFLTKFRKVPDNRDIPIIILTNISKDEAPRTLWHLGISGYFIKANHTPSDLISIIRKLIP
jgi:two-component system chemotaxis sensor kinase CheA